jgi:hypothetical protein
MHIAPIAGGLRGMIYTEIEVRGAKTDLHSGDATGQMALFTADTHFVVYMDAKSSNPTQEVHSRESLAPVFENLKSYKMTTHFNGQSTVQLDGSRATGVSYCLAHHVSAGVGKDSLMVAWLNALVHAGKMLSIGVSISIAHYYKPPSNCRTSPWQQINLNITPISTKQVSSRPRDRPVSRYCILRDGSRPSIFRTDLAEDRRGMWQVHFSNRSTMARPAKRRGRAHPD